MHEFENRINECDEPKESLSSDDVGHVPPESDNVRPNPSLSDTVGQNNSDTDEIWLTTDQIVQRLSDRFGVNRDRRSAERYCNSGKVRAFLDDAQGIWFAEQSSVDILAAQLLEIQNRRNPDRQGTVPEPNQENNQTNSSAPENPKQASESRKEDQLDVHDLRAKVMQLEFEVKSKSDIINHLQSAREKDRDKFIELATETGEYKAELKQLNSVLQLTDGGAQESRTIPVQSYSPSENDLIDSDPR